MTTVLADLNHGVMVSDSSISDGDRVWSQRKVWRIRGHLLGFAGHMDEIESFLAWWRAGHTDKFPRFDHSSALVLSVGGLVLYNAQRAPEPIKRGVEAVGTGAKAVMCAYEALGWQDPARAVRLTCKHDAYSRRPVRTYTL